MTCIKPSPELLRSSMKNVRNVRNVCILAHVDHGKTTLADSLLATNRLVSKRVAGKLRYLDDREDEQERGITMKSSGVSLLNTLSDPFSESSIEILLNLIDTPGHIDFSTEVSAALRVSDGAIILLDVVEGVCVQTREAIRQGFEEKTKMILVINKIDKLVVDLGKEVNDMFHCILRCIEDCNAIIAELYQHEFFEHDSVGDIENSGYLFTPDSGNVIFASAFDGWGFTTKQMAKMFVDFVSGETVDSLDKKFWDFDCYVDGKSKTIKKGAVDNGKPNLFIQFCLKTIHYIYNTIVVRMENDKLPLILEKLNITNITRDMNHNDHKIRARSILQAWKPLADTILLQCFHLLPSPDNISLERINHLLNINKFLEDDYLRNCVKALIPHFKNDSTDVNPPSIAYISKMFCVDNKNLSQNKPKPFIPGLKSKGQDEVSKMKRDLERGPHSVSVPEDKDADNKNLSEDINGKVVAENLSQEPNQSHEPQNEMAVIALARIFSGKLKLGQEVYVLSSSYIPISETTKCENVSNIQKIIINELYMLYGREMISVDEVPFGNICGIGGLDSVILRTGTISSILECVPIIETIGLPPVIRHAIEPVNPKELPILRRGLKLLMQSDSCVQVVTQETGELVLITAGDVHLAKCLEDLQKKFAKIEINVSSPMVSLRETVVDFTEKYEFAHINTVDVKTSHFKFSVAAVPLPLTISKIIQQYYQLLSSIEEHQQSASIDLQMKRKLSPNELKEPEHKKFVSDATNHSVQRVKQMLHEAFKSSPGSWPGLETKIWSVGKMHDSINLLINYTPNYQCDIFHTINETDIRSCFDSVVVNAFNTCCKAGPICEEPLMNCAFIIKQFDLDRSNSYFDLSAHEIAGIDLVLRCSFREALEKQSQRIMEPYFMTEVQINPSILGKVYSVINRRHGKVIEAAGMDEEEKMFLFKAYLPVIESAGFVNEIRKTTSGQGIPILRFSHFEVIEGDPFYEPTSDDEDDDEVGADLSIRATKLRNEVRRRKGLSVDEQVVIHAEKQRTLNKKK